MTKPKVKVDPEKEAALAEAFADAIDAETLNPALAALYSELGIEQDGQVSVYIYKGMPDGTEARIWQGSPDEYQLQALAKKFGSGAYRVTLRGPTPTSGGRSTIIGNRVFPILLEPGEDAAIEARRNAPVVAPNASATSGVSVQDIATAVAAAMSSAMAPILAAVNKPAVSPMEMLTGLAGIVKSIAPPPPAASALNPLEMLKMGLELARGNRGSDPDDDPPPTTGANTTDLFMRMIDKFAPAFLAATQAQAPAPATIEGTATPAAPQAALAPPEDEMSIRLKFGLGFLVMQAKAARDAATYADVVLDNVPEVSMEQILALPNPIEYFAGFDPAVRDHVPWFTALLAEVRMQFEDEEAPPLTPPAETSKTEGDR